MLDRNSSNHVIWAPLASGIISAVRHLLSSHWNEDGIAREMVGPMLKLFRLLSANAYCTQ